MADNKGRIVFIEHYLMNHTDEEQPIRTDDLIAVFSRNGFSANRNTIRDDIAALREQGVAVASVRIGNAKGYYIKGRPFKTTELKTLIDAVSSSQFISERNSKALIYQLALLAPERYREDLYATAYTSDRVKTDNPAAFATLDKIYKAVQAKKKFLSNMWITCRRKRLSSGIRERDMWPLHMSSFGQTGDITPRPMMRRRKR